MVAAGPPWLLSSLKNCNQIVTLCNSFVNSFFVFPPPFFLRSAKAVFFTNIMWYLKNFGKNFGYSHQKYSILPSWPEMASIYFSTVPSRRIKGRRQESGAVRRLPAAKGE